MKKVIDAIKMGEKIGRKLSGKSTKEDDRMVADWRQETAKNDFMLKKLSDPDFIRDKVAYYDNFETTKTWKDSKVRLFIKEKRTRSRRIRYAWESAAAITVFAMIYILFHFAYRNETPKERADVHQAIAQLLPGRGIPMLYTENNQAVSLDAQARVDDGNKRVEAGRGTITYSKGQAQREEEYNKLVVPRGGEYHLVLADGSEIWLNSESTLRYFVHDIDKERVVYLQGEAYFKISKNEKRPFKVVSGDHVVKVLGTEFNINTRNGDAMIYTTLLSGRVGVDITNHPDVHQILSERGKQSVYNPVNKGITIRRVDPRVYTAWKEGYFVFDYSTLREVFYRLSRWYDFEYEADQEMLDGYHFSGEFKRFDNLDNVLEIIRSTGIPFTLDYQKGKIIVRRNGL